MPHSEPELRVPRTLALLYFSTYACAYICFEINLQCGHLLKVSVTCTNQHKCPN